jgi:rod shape-determining protein MreD
MKGPIGCIWVGISLLVAAILQQALAPRIPILGGHPDFLLLALALLAYGRPVTTAMTIGFSDGLLMGSMSGANMQHYIASRTLVGFLIGLTSRFQEKPSVGSIGVYAVGAAIVTQLVLMFLAPPHGIAGFLADTIRTAVYNGVLAITVFALLKRFTSRVSH